MEVFEVVIARLVGGAALAAVARRLGAPYPALVALAGAALALTVAVVAVVARALVPEMPWGAAIALGAIVAPPDAAAATTVLRQLRPPLRADGTIGDAAFQRVEAELDWAHVVRADEAP